MQCTTHDDKLESVSRFNKRYQSDIY